MPYIDKQKLKEEVIRNLTPMDILEHHGHTLYKGSGDNSFHTTHLHGGKNNKNALHINKVNGTWLWRDFSNKLGGTSYNLLWEFNSSREDVIKEYEELTGREIKKSLSHATEDSEEKLYSNILTWNDNISNPKNKDAEKALDYLLDRGYTEDYIKDHKIGFNSYYSKKYKKQQKQIIFPFWDLDGRPKTFIYRSLNEDNDSPKYVRDKYHSTAGTYEYLPYNLHTTLYKSDVVIVEGIVDSDMIALYSDYGTISLSGSGTAEETWERSILPAIENEKVTLIFDNDTEGKKYYITNAERLISHGIYDFNIAIVPKNDHLSIKDTYNLHFKETEKEDHLYKDINDYYIKNQNLNGIFNTKVNGLHYLGMAYKFNNEVEKFEELLQKYSRFISQARLNEILSQLQEDGIYDEETIKELRTITKTPPSDYTVSQDILSEHELMFNKGLGFLEFNKVWCSLPEDRLYKYINDTLGKKYSKGSRLTPLTKYLQGECSSYRITFNDKEKFVFKNGTLDLETGKFQEGCFNSQDFMTNITSYDYDPNATCRNWEQFLWEVCEVKDDTEEIKRKISILQEFAGYVLFSDNRLETALILYGEGSNGKSVYMNTIRSVFGGDNKFNALKSITSVDVSDFGRDHHAIDLKDSFLNITSEAKGTFRGSEEKFKKLVTGESFNDSHKYKDNIEFTTRAKFIISANNEILPSDKSKGFWRRILFVNFVNTFTDKPLYEGEKVKNVDLPKKIKRELSGIFNWCYEGYKRLKENKKFTETKEHELLLESHKENADNVRQYVKSECFMSLVECNHGKAIPVRTIYENYEYFCSDNRLSALSFINFSKQLNRTLKDLRILFESKRTSRYRAYIFKEFPQSYYDLIEGHNIEYSNKLIEDQQENFLNDKDFTEI